MAAGGGYWVEAASAHSTTAASSGRFIGASGARTASQHVQPRPRAQPVLHPEAGVREPADGLVGARRLHHGQRARALEEAAEHEPPGAARLDQRELRHVLVGGGAFHDRRHARAVDDERHALPRLDEVRERVRRVGRPRPGEEVRILLDGGRDLTGLLQPIEDVDAPAVGRGPAADHDARRPQALQALEMRAAMQLALGGVVLRGGDGEMEDDHAGEPTTRGTVVKVERFERFRAKFSFALDDFQVEAIRAIDADQSVIVSARTGSGKTLVAEYAIQCALETGRRIAYTTPLKALSNQKFNDFTRAYGADKVGILTGDVKVNPQAQVLVMTTEILRNALFGSGLDDLGHIVLDECHYMGDEGRGTVWEEIIVNAPKDVLLVGLSATVANVKEIADWISIVHRPIVPIFHPHRPVPLSYAVADLAGEIHEIAEVRAGRARLVGDESRGPDARGRWYTRRVVDPVVLIADLEARGWLPAIYFIFSRAGCERAMDDVLAEGRGLLSATQQDDVDRAINELVEESPTVAESALNQTVFQTLRLGVGLHHAGILPSLKRLIELLFERGLCKVVFATETMSLGIHMPARSVVLQGVTKRTDRGFRALSHNELTQMAGRAGRRGIDPEGKCVIALDARDGVDEILRVVDGSPEPIESQFKLGYGSAALLLATGAPPEALRRRIESSFGQYQNLKRIREMEGEIRSLEAALAEVKRYAAPCGDFPRIGRYRRARQEVEARRQALGRGGRRGERNVAEAETGRLALVRRKGGPGLALILGMHSIRGHRVHAEDQRQAGPPLAP